MIYGICIVKWVMQPAVLNFPILLDMNQCKSVYLNVIQLPHSDKYAYVIYCVNVSMIYEEQINLVVSTVVCARLVLFHYHEFLASRLKINDLRERDLYLLSIGLCFVFAISLNSDVLDVIMSQYQTHYFGLVNVMLQIY